MRPVPLDIGPKSLNRWMIELPGDIENRNVRSFPSQIGVSTFRIFGFSGILC